MKSLKERLLDAAKFAADYGPGSLRDLGIVELLREAAISVPCHKLASSIPVGDRAPMRFDAALVGTLTRVIYTNGLHERNREDTIGVLMRCGAFHESEYEPFVADLAAAIDEYKANHTLTDSPMSVVKMRFGELEVGDRFIGFPIPGDNHGHGGYLGGNRLFVKTQMKVERMHDSGAAKNGSGVESTFPQSMTVIKVILT